MPLGTRRMVQIKESLLKLFHGDSGFVRIREMFELGGVELERVHCISVLQFNKESHWL